MLFFLHHWVRGGRPETTVLYTITDSPNLSKFVTFEDANDTFQLHLQQKTLDSLELYVTDDKGRLLAEVDPRQADLGLMSFKCVLRWDHVGAPAPPAYVGRISDRALPPVP